MCLRKIPSTIAGRLRGFCTFAITSGVTDTQLMGHGGAQLRSVS